MKHEITRPGQLPMHVEMVSDAPEEDRVGLAGRDEPVELLLAPGHLRLGLSDNLIHAREGIVDCLLKPAQTRFRGSFLGELLEVHREELNVEPRGIGYRLYQRPLLALAEIVKARFPSLHRSRRDVDTVGEARDVDPGVGAGRAYAPPELIEISQ